jgi:predicted DCC family thiol-disulfide oxidoreductase YuxK
LTHFFPYDNSTNRRASPNVGLSKAYELITMSRKQIENAPATAATTTDIAPLPVVLFDGGCPLCSREIDHYRRVRGADQIQWVDISKTPNLQWLYGIDPDTAMRRFHVRRSDGAWVTGAYGFAEVWMHLRGYRIAGLLVTKARLLPLLDWAYRRFADWRFERRRCDGDRCAVTPRADTNQGISK